MLHIKRPLISVNGKHLRRHPRRGRAGIAVLLAVTLSCLSVLGLFRISAEASAYTQERLEEAVSSTLAEIIQDGMTDVEKARAIFDFAHDSIRYTGDSDKSDWQAGAYEGLTKRQGDCFTYYAVSRALLTAAGIDNLEVTRVGGPTSHYWNLIRCGGGWYHFDATPRSSKMPPFVSFLFTDREAADYTEKAGRNYYTFDGSLYPERAAE